jgi:fumarate reductase subunit C
MKNQPKPGSYRKPYTPKQSRWWWTKNPFFLRYMIREGTSVFVLVYSLILILGLYQLKQGEAGWQQWLSLLNHPVIIAFNLLALAAALYHAVTWFKLAPKIMVVRLGDWKLPERLMVVGQWIGMLLISSILLTLTLMAGA